MITWVRVGVAAAAVLLVVGCTSSDDDPPAAEPTGSPSSSGPAPPEVSASSEPTPTVSPLDPDDAPPEPREGMHEYSQAGVAEFTRYVIDVINYSYRTNDVELLQAISTADCQFCANAVEGLTFVASEGGRIEGGQLEPSVNTFDIIGPAEGFETSAGVDLVLTGSTTFDGVGNVRSSEEERQRYIILDYAREGETWMLDEVRNVSRPSS